MTIEEYEQRIVTELVVAHNNKDMTALTSVFRRADETLTRSNIGPIDRKEFWEKVREKVVHSSRLLIEKQSNSALVALMQAIEREIAARTGKSK